MVRFSSRKNERKAENTRRFKTKLIPLNTFLSASKCDTILYNKYKNNLKKMGLSGVRIESVSSANDFLLFRLIYTHVNLFSIV